MAFYFKNLRLDKIYSRDISLAQITVKRISAKTCKQIDADPLLRERNFGEFFYQLRKKIIRRFSDSREMRFTYRQKNGEIILDVKKG